MTEELHPQRAETEAAGEPKKISLAEAMKLKLAQKKQAQAGGKGNQDHYSTDTKKMQNQINKKPNNQKRRTGV
ncbi:hypothetical protein [Cohnella nanjingensis]|uniref:Uncharacterized protein n=1 Tax=Cohnella nanjingensis TaxID=1387779 RepID=A0A7X0VII3_9BACL|nr:hypothetical protein [Cohnella nanjingensis]MBB6673689.1 hypothetical protein [Cohnella nanjingensis]